MPRQYERLRVLGSGTFGKAWLVRAAGDTRLCVLKEINVATMSPREREQALTEVTILSRCRHANIIRYREAHVSGTALHIVMAYAEGGDLHERIQQQAGALFPGATILDWFVQLCFALKYIHGQGILHRDLKTRNIFLSSANVVKVGDFGISRILADSETHAQTVVGTPYYLSPEICSQQPYNHLSDMWSAGCILYELSTLKPPFLGPDIASLVLQITRGQYAPLPSSCGALLEDLVSVLLRVSAKTRPNAEQILSVPALSPYISDYMSKQEGKLDGSPRTPTAAARQHDGVAAESRVNDSDCTHSLEEKSAPPPRRKTESEIKMTKVRRFSLQTPTDVKRTRRSSPGPVCGSEDASRRTLQRAFKQETPRLALFREVIHRQRERSQSLNSMQGNSPRLRNGGKTYKILKYGTPVYKPTEENQPLTSSQRFSENGTQKVDLVDENNNSPVGSVCFNVRSSVQDTTVNSSCSRTEYAQQDEHDAPAVSTSTSSEPTDECAQEDTLESKLFNLFYTNLDQNNSLLESLERLQCGVEGILGHDTTVALMEELHSGCGAGPVLVRIGERHQVAVPYLLQLLQMRRWVQAT